MPHTAATGQIISPPVPRDALRADDSGSFDDDGSWEDHLAFYSPWGFGLADIQAPAASGTACGTSFLWPTPAGQAAAFAWLTAHA